MLLEQNRRPDPNLTQWTFPAYFGASNFAFALLSAETSLMLVRRLASQGFQRLDCARTANLVLVTALFVGNFFIHRGKSLFTRNAPKPALVNISMPAFMGLKAGIRGKMFGTSCAVRERFFCLVFQPFYEADPTVPPVLVHLPLQRFRLFWDVPPSYARAAVVPPL